MENDFAKSLCNQFDKRGSLSDRQWEFVDKLLNQEKLKEEANTTKLWLNSVDTVLSQLKTTVKYPKVRVQSEQGLDYILKFNKEDQIQVLSTREGQTPYGWGKLWMGKVVDGRFVPGKNCSSDVLPLLEKLSAMTPYELITSHGHLTGQCSICVKTLKAEKSLELGVGPMCARNNV
jgi:hypothetical protein